MQNNGETVEDYAQRFKRLARKVGNDITEIGKAGTFTRGLLSAIQNLAVLGDQSTLERAIESAKRGEKSAISSYQQLLPNQDTNYSVMGNASQNMVYEKLRKEKADETSMDELTRAMKEIKIHLLENEK
jgi:hypothetical protein